MGNFYSRWSDKEMEEVVLPILQHFGITTLNLSMCRGFNNKESKQSLQQLPMLKHTFVNKINLAISLHYRKIEPVSIEKIIKSWNYLSGLENSYDSKSYRRYNYNHHMMTDPGMWLSISPDMWFASNEMLCECSDIEDSM